MKLIFELSKFLVFTALCMIILQATYDGMISIGIFPPSDVGETAGRFWRHMYTGLSGVAVGMMYPDSLRLKLGLKDMLWVLFPLLLMSCEQEVHIKSRVGPSDTYKTRQIDIDELRKYGEFEMATYEYEFLGKNYYIITRDSVNVLTRIRVPEYVYDYYRDKRQW